MCRCAVSGVDESLLGNNCTLRDSRPNTNGWCFLENVQHPEEPACSCFKDATWSTTHGRFFSNLACGDPEDGEIRKPKKGENCEHLVGPEILVPPPPPLPPKIAVPVGDE